MDDRVRGIMIQVVGMATVKPELEKALDRSCFMLFHYNTGLAVKSVASGGQRSDFKAKQSRGMGRPRNRSQLPDKLTSSLGGVSTDRYHE